MSNQPILTNYIILLGTFYSGFRAVYDYLFGRWELNDPLQGAEYQLPQMLWWFNVCWYRSFYKKYEVEMKH